VPEEFCGNSEFLLVNGIENTPTGYAYYGLLYCFEVEEAL
jgi:hypothetical protein